MSGAGRRWPMGGPGPGWAGPARDGFPGRRELQGQPRVTQNARSLAVKMLVGRRWEVPLPDPAPPRPRYHFEDVGGVQGARTVQVEAVQPLLLENLALRGCCEEAWVLSGKQQVAKENQQVRASEMARKGEAGGGWGGP